MRKPTTIGVAAVAIAMLGITAATAAPTPSGPSSSTRPYLVRSVPGVVPTSVLTVGDRAANGYKMVGIPDGLGTYDNGDGTFTVLMNHELRPDVGSVRAHGSRGAFVSKWTIDQETLTVQSGEDLIKRVFTSSSDGTWTQSTVAFNRFCSADLPDRSAFYNAATGKGTPHRIFMNGEEAGAEGRVFGHVVEESGRGILLRAASAGQRELGERRRDARHRRQDRRGDAGRHRRWPAVRLRRRQALDRQRRARRPG